MTITSAAERLQGYGFEADQDLRNYTVFGKVSGQMELENRITSYNVCYTKLLRKRGEEFAGESDEKPRKPAAENIEDRGRGIGILHDTRHALDILLRLFVDDVGDIIEGDDAHGMILRVHDWEGP